MLATQYIFVGQSIGPHHRLVPLIRNLSGTPAQRIFEAVEALAAI
jgi:hypothetical protein